MKATKVMSIIGIVLAPLSYLCMAAFDNSYDYPSAIGWGIIVTAYLLAFSIVVLVRSKKVGNNE